MISSRARALTVAAVIATSSTLVATTPAAPAAASRISSPAPVASAVKPAPLRVNAPAKVKAKKPVRITGLVVTSKKARRVTLRIKEGGRWRKATKKTSRAGAFSFTVQPKKTTSKLKVQVVVAKYGRLKKRTATRTVKIVSKSATEATAPPKPPTQQPGPASTEKSADSGDLTVTWADTRLNAAPGAKFTATGRLKGRDASGRSVVAERKYADGWHVVARTKTADDGTYKVSVPAWFYASTPARVRVAETETAKGYASAHVRLTAQPDYEPVGKANAYEFLGDGINYRWDPCSDPITYRTNFARAPKGAAKLFQGVVAKVSRATGLEFKHLGETKAHAYAKKSVEANYPRPGDTQVVVSFSSQDQVTPSFATAIGWGGPQRGWLSRDADGKLWAAEGGAVLLNSEGWDRWDSEDLDGIMTHELLHVLGLSHASDRLQVMHGSWGWQPNTNLQAGDLVGAEKVGVTRGCVKNRVQTVNGVEVGGAKIVDLPASFTHPVYRRSAQ